MPIHSHIDPVRRRLFTRAEGLVTYSEMRVHVQMDLSPEAASYDELFDCSGARTNVTPAEIHQLAGERQDVNSRQRRPGGVAIVAADDISFGMFRMFDALTEQIRPIRVFRDAHEAEQWLDEDRKRAVTS